MTMEKIMPRRFHASWKPHHTTQIITDRKLAINSIACDNPNLKIFTDGSPINDKIGPAQPYIVTTGKSLLTMPTRIHRPPHSP